MNADELLKLVISARDTIISAPSPHILPIVPSNLFSIPQSLSPKSGSITLTPKMNQVRSIALLGDVMTFTDSLVLLDSQYIFDIVYGDDPTMLTLISRKKVQCATENMDYLITKLNESCNLCRLHIFCDSVQLEYVGTDVYDSQKMLANISLALSKLKMVYSVRGNIFLSSPMTYLVILPRFCLYFLYHVYTVRLSQGMKIYK